MGSQEHCGGGITLICNVYWFPWSKYSQHSQFQLIDVTSLNMELGVDAHRWPPNSPGGWPVKTANCAALPSCIPMGFANGGAETTEPLSPLQPLPTACGLEVTVLTRGLVRLFPLSLYYITRLWWASLFTSPWPVCENFPGGGLLDQIKDDQLDMNFRKMPNNFFFSISLASIVHGTYLYWKKKSLFIWK